MSARATLVWVLSFAVGCAGALATFPVPVLWGDGAFWLSPHGFVIGSWADMGTALAGYTAYAQADWQWPPFHVASLGGTAGTDIIFLDSTPLLSLAGRVLFRLTGRVIPLYGAWAGLSMIGMALASAALVRALGARSAVAAVAAALIGVSMPALLARWGHLSLMGQWLIPLALAAYVGLHRRARLSFGRAWAVVTGLSALALLIHPYLFFMVVAVLETAPLQAAYTRRMPVRTALGVVAASLAPLIVLMGAMGYFTMDSLEPARGFGSFSTNLLSPFLPQMSGLLPGPDFILQGTAGQYEGFAYLGAGLLLLIFMTGRGLAALRWTAHPFLLAVVLGFTLLAVSNRVYAAEMRLFTLPLPDAALRWLGVVRASGRFIWLPLYLTAGLVVALAARFPRAGLVLLLAGGLQWADAAPLRARVRAGMLRPEPVPLDAAALAEALQQVDGVLLDPPWLCIRDKPEWFFRVGMQVQLAASRAGRTTNTVYAARGRADCGLPSGRARMLILYPHAEPPDLVGEEGCIDSADMTACSAVLDPALLRRLTQVRTDFE